MKKYTSTNWSMIFDRLNSIQENKIFRALVLDFLELRKHMITWCCWQNSVWTRLMVAVSSEGGTVFPRQLCAMSSVQCPAAGRWRPAPHTQLLSGLGTSHHAETMHPVWHGMAWLPIIEWPGRGVNTNTELCGEAVFTNIVLLPSITVCTLPNCEVCPQWCHTVQQRIRADVGQLDSITTPPIIRLAHTGSTEFSNLHVLTNGHYIIYKHCWTKLLQSWCWEERVLVACGDVPRVASWQHTGHRARPWHKRGTHQLVNMVNCTLHTHISNLGSENTGVEHVLQL